MTLLEKTADLGDRKRAMIDRLDGWSSERIRQQPAEGGWCALEVADHLLTSERGTLGYLVKKTSSGYGALETATAEHEAASAKLNEALASDGRWSAPAVLPPPDDSLQWEVVRQQWLDIQDQFERFRAAFPETAAEKLVFRHPLAGRFTFAQTLDFLRYHIQHHEYQLDRIVSALG